MYQVDEDSGRLYWVEDGERRLLDSDSAQNYFALPAGVWDGYG